MTIDNAKAHELMNAGFDEAADYMLGDYMKAVMAEKIQPPASVIDSAAGVDWVSLEQELSAGADQPDWDCSWCIPIIKRHIAAQSPAQDKQEPDAGDAIVWWHVLCDEHGNDMQHKFTFERENPFDKPYRDYSATWSVKSHPLYNRPPHPKPAGEDKQHNTAGTLPEDQRTAQPETTGSSEIDRSERLHNSQGDAAKALEALNAAIDRREGGGNWVTLSLFNCAKIQAALSKPETTVPEGWKLVPSMATTEMIDAFYKSAFPIKSGSNVATGYLAMLSAAQSRTRSRNDRN